jgi:hypothetical protein
MFRKVVLSSTSASTGSRGLALTGDKNVECGEKLAHKPSIESFFFDE